ncbi:hypothetical protein fugu_005114 [Takifugu bimaculatus]|uniref:VWFA domain-containing protein n=1 Tax=Takifugu bimaculatus TaxID=433685 RepID=A0A4Z2BCM3_9TELE|nr:hypothetical protein fugu_005114 [Takifugu bimaculatus]
MLGVWRLLLAHACSTSLPLWIILGLNAVETAGSQQGIPLSVVKLWASAFGGEIKSISAKYSGSQLLQKKHKEFVKTVKVEEIDGMKLVKNLAVKMEEVFQKKAEATRRLVEAAEEAHRQHEENPELQYEYFNAVLINEVDEMGNNVELGGEFLLEPNDHFNNLSVNVSLSVVQVPTNMYNKDPDIVNGVYWSEALNKVFVDNFERDPTLTWQYIQAATSPKDVVILVDVSGSMKGLRLTIARQTVSSILDTLGDDDFFNIIAYNQEIHYVEPCLNGTLVRADRTNKDHFREHLDKLFAKGIGLLGEALAEAFTILSDFNRTGRGSVCSQAIMLVTDGATEMYDDVFEKYNWPERKDKIQKDTSLHVLRNLSIFERADVYVSPAQVRIFPYLIGRESAFADNLKWMACDVVGAVLVVGAPRAVVPWWCCWCGWWCGAVFCAVAVLWWWCVLVLVGGGVLVLPVVVVVGWWCCCLCVVWCGCGAVLLCCLWWWVVLVLPVVGVVVVCGAGAAVVVWWFVVLLGCLVVPAAAGGGAAVVVVVVVVVLRCFVGAVLVVVVLLVLWCPWVVLLVVVWCVAGYFSQISTLADVQENVMRYLHVMSRPKVIDHEHDTVWTEAYVDSALSQAHKLNEKVGPSLMTTVAMPVFSTKNETKNQGILLGVVGTDIPLPELMKLIPKHMLGIHGYAFAITNNGYILTHPDLRPLYQDGQKRRKPNYSSVDLSEVEWEDKDDFLRNSMVNRRTGTFSMEVKKTVDRGRRVLKMHNDYYFTDIKGTPFRDFLTAEDKEGVFNADHFPLWYKRAAEQVPGTFVYSIPFSTALENKSVVLASTAIQLLDDRKSPIVAAVGIQMKLEFFQRKFWTACRQCTALDGKCSISCDSEDINCYLIDNNGFILVTEEQSQTGLFFGEVEGAVMNKLLQMGSFKRITLYDYQALCKEYTGSSDSARTLSDPFSVMKWLLTEIVM